MVKPGPIFHFLWKNTENLIRKIITESYNQCSCRNDQSEFDNSLGQCRNMGKEEYAVVTKGEKSPKRK